VRVTKSGRTIQVSITVSPIRDETGQIVAACKIARDITEQEATRARLESLQLQLLYMSRLNDMGQMATAFAHELEQPLSAIGLYIAGVKRQISRGDWTKAQLGCDLAAAQTERAGQAMKRLREFLRKGDPQRTVEDVRELVEEACALSLIGPTGAGIRVERQFPKEPLFALVDKVQVQQVIVNIVWNALEAMASAPARLLTLAVDRAGARRMVITIADNGPGIDESVTATLFEPFTTTRKTRMGMGLSLCRTIVEAHGGVIWAEAGPAGGAVFMFTLEAI